MPQLQAPDIRQIPLTDIDPTGLPPRETIEFETAVTSRYALEYAAKGWSALITVDETHVRILALPEHGIEPKNYVLGLLENGFLSDALPMLEAMDAMLRDVDVAYNLGLCLSELGRPDDAVPALQKALELDPSHTHAAIALGVAYAKQDKYDDAVRVLTDVVLTTPDDALAKRNLAAVLMRGGRPNEALPYFRQAANLAPSDPGAQIGLAQCLEALGDTYLNEATNTYRAVVKRFANHAVGEMAEQALTRISQRTMRSNVGGGLRMDAVMYMQSALARYATMDRAEVGRITMEIAMIGRQGLEVNNPARRYTLESMKGDFSALELISYLHVGMQMFDPQADTGTGLDREYQSAKALTAKR